MPNKWGHNADRRGTRDLPLEEGFVVHSKENFGFARSMEREGDLFFHMSEAPVDIQLQDEVEFFSTIGQRDGVSFSGITKRNNSNGSSHRPSTRRGRDEELTTWRLAGQGSFQDERMANNDVENREDKKHDSDRSSTKLFPQLGYEVRFRVAKHRKEGVKRATDLSITLSAREKLEKEIEAKLATMTRENGVVNRVKNGGGFIKCFDRPVDIYLPFHEKQRESNASRLRCPISARECVCVAAAAQRVAMGYSNSTLIRQRQLHLLQQQQQLRAHNAEAVQQLDQQQ
ncbi:hypothetical protein PsorP6_012250 [Peronosclerospora sorghi]|uniref:Uncharacterized protein n=1 Tax=Peronosclerospora sorghi TaxID=230839 RepID=A0ACC0WKV1_9STRA|nr:hypothetical protein PsorP6_012250 [Peronosclerospora sorghi]